MSIPVTTVEAAVMGHILAVVDRDAPAVPVDVETNPPAAVRDDAVILRSGGSYMKSTLHFQRVDSLDEPLPALPGTELQAERVRLSWRVRSGDLVIDALHRGSLPVPDLGLHAGIWAVDVLVWGRDAAGTYETKLLDEEDRPVFPVGPEVWLLRFAP